MAEKAPLKYEYDSLTRPPGFEKDAEAELVEALDEQAKDPLFFQWLEIADQAAPNLLNKNGLCIAKDGGVSGISGLMYPMQYFYAGLLVASCLANIFIICRQGHLALNGDADPAIVEAGSMFLLTRRLVDGFTNTFGVTAFDGNTLHVRLLVPLLEFVVLLGLTVNILVKVCLAVLAPRLTWVYGAAGELYRWKYVADLFWNHLEHLSTFSAMRLLYYVTPSVLGTQAYVMAWLVKEEVAAASSVAGRLRALLPAVHYMCTCLVFTVVGLDAFLVKYRMAAKFMMSNELDLSGLLSSLIFLTQVLGIVNLNRFTRERLFIFIFGGEDGNVDPEEKMLWEVWTCFLTRKIYQTYGLFRGTVVMMGFDDYDFQSLVLDEHPASQGRNSKKPTRRSGGSSHKRQSLAQLDPLTSVPDLIDSFMEVPQKQPGRRQRPSSQWRRQKETQVDQKSFSNLGSERYRTSAGGLIILETMEEEGLSSAGLSSAGLSSAGLSSKRWKKKDYPRLDYPRLDYPRLDYPRLDYPRLDYPQPLRNPG